VWVQCLLQNQEGGLDQQQQQQQLEQDAQQLCQSIAAAA